MFAASSSESRTNCLGLVQISNKAHAGIMVWLKSFEDFWIFDHSFALFSINPCCELEFLATLPHSPLIFAAPLPLWDLGMR